MLGSSCCKGYTKSGIKSCDEVLKSVEISLTSFQNDLGLVSAEIETLQSRSAAMNTRLDNRNVVEKLLGPAVEDISISPAIVQTISEGPVNEDWAKALAELEKRTASIQGKAKLPNPPKAIQDVKPLIDNLIAMVNLCLITIPEEYADSDGRLSREYATFWSPRSKPCDHLV